MTDLVERLRERIAYDKKHYPPVDPLFNEAAAEIERLREALERYENARLGDVSDEEAGRMIKAFFDTVEKWSGEEWEDERARRLGLMNMGLMQAMVMAAQSNAETFTHTVTGLTHKGEHLGDWTVTISRAALSKVSGEGV